MNCMLWNTFFTSHMEQCCQMFSSGARWTLEKWGWSRLTLRMQNIVVMMPRIGWALSGRFGIWNNTYVFSNSCVSKEIRLYTTCQHRSWFSSSFIFIPVKHIGRYRYSWTNYIKVGKRNHSLGYWGMSTRTRNRLYPTTVHVLNDHVITWHYLKHTFRYCCT